MKEKEKLNALDLFSGIGGNSLALGEWVNTIAYCEADRHAQAVLLSRMSEGKLKPAPICGDVTKLDGNELRGHVDLIIAGFPCQDISSDGKGAGLEGKRSSLFYEVLRLAVEVKPAFLFLENVANIRTRGLATVVEELTVAGYDCRWVTLSASDIGAPHKRQRWFLLANSKSVDNRRKVRHLSEENAEQSEPKESRKEASGEPVDASDNATVLASEHNTRSCHWEAQPAVGRMADGVPHRLDRLKRLGNAVVPAQAREAFKILMGVE